MKSLVYTGAARLFESGTAENFTVFECGSATPHHLFVYSPETRKCYCGDLYLQPF